MSVERLGIVEHLQARAKAFVERYPMLRQRVRGGFVEPAKVQTAPVVVEAFVPKPRIPEPVPFWLTPVGMSRLSAVEDVLKMEGEPPTVAAIVQAVSDVSGQRSVDILGPRRSRTIAWPRHVAVLLTCELRPDLSMPQIGRMFGGRDHTTIMHAKRAARLRIAEESASRIWYRDALAILQPKPEAIAEEEPA